ncbi:MAG: hypothetical protein FJW39_05800 [Acidobacteria bacterium]|nr:hypothetical protein [Acidobacteriota bacterium]
MTRRFFPLFAAALLAAPAAAQVADPIIGTWAITVLNATDPTKVEFRAIHTYHADGTFTENSTLAPAHREGPAQGAWRRDGDQYRLTFQLFTFDEKGEFAGFVRVRCTMRIAQAGRLEASTVVDFIEPNGTVNLAIGNGPFVGRKLSIDPSGPAAF